MSDARPEVTGRKPRRGDRLEAHFSHFEPKGSVCGAAAGCTVRTRALPLGARAAVEVVRRRRRRVEVRALEVLDLGSMEVHRVVTAKGRVYGTAWTRDGGHLLYNDDSDGDQEIYRADVHTGAGGQLTDNDAPDHQPVADTIVFTSERDGTERVYVMDLQSRKTALVDVS